MLSSILATPTMKIALGNLNMVQRQLPKIAVWGVPAAFAGNFLKFMIKDNN
jgi:hypothetical protein